MGEMEGLRWEVASRDDFRCIASRVDPDSGPCYSRWGKQLPDGRVPLDEGEIDYVRLGATTPHHEDARDHVWVCPGHHRGTGPNRGVQWATSHRRAEREYLDTVNGVIVRADKATMSVDGGEPVDVSDVVIEGDR